MCNEPYLCHWCFVWELNEMIHVKYLEAWVVCSKHLLNVVIKSTVSLPLCLPVPPTSSVQTAASWLFHVIFPPGLPSLPLVYLNPAYSCPLPRAWPWLLVGVPSPPPLAVGPQTFHLPVVTPPVSHVFIFSLKGQQRPFFSYSSFVHEKHPS